LRPAAARSASRLAVMAARKQQADANSSDTEKYINACSRAQIEPVTGSTAVPSAAASAAWVST